MDGAVWALLVVLVLAGTTMIVLGRMQRDGTLRRNELIGLRTSATLASDEAWDAAHAATAPLMVAAGLPPIIGAAVLAAWRPSDPGAAAVILGSLGLMLGLVVFGCVRGHRIAVGVHDQAERATEDSAS